MVFSESLCFTATVTNYCRFLPSQAAMYYERSFLTRLKPNELYSSCMECGLIESTRGQYQKCQYCPLAAYCSRYDICAVQTIMLSSCMEFGSVKATGPVPGKPTVKSKMSSSYIHWFRFQCSKCTQSVTSCDIYFRNNYSFDSPAGYQKLTKMCLLVTYGSMYSCHPI